MAITKTKEEVYEWFTTKNWFKLYERNLFAFPRQRVKQSSCTNFKDYLDYAYKHFKEEGSQSYVEFLIMDIDRLETEQGFLYWRHIDESYWTNWMCEN